MAENKDTYVGHWDNLSEVPSPSDFLKGILFDILNPPTVEDLDLTSLTFIYEPKVVIDGPVPNVYVGPRYGWEIKVK